MSICQRLRGCPGRRTFSAKTKAHWDSWSPRSALGHCLLDFSRLLLSALLSFGPLLPEDCYQTQLLPSALFSTLQRLPWPLGSSSNPRAWPPKLFLHWFLALLERLISHNFHNTPDTVSFSHPGSALCYSGPWPMVVYLSA